MGRRQERRQPSPGFLTLCLPGGGLSLRRRRTRATGQRCGTPDPTPSDGDAPGGRSTPGHKAVVWEVQPERCDRLGAPHLERNPVPLNEQSKSQGPSLSVLPWAAFSEAVREHRHWQRWLPPSTGRARSKPLNQEAWAGVSPNPLGADGEVRKNSKIPPTTTRACPGRVGAWDGPLLREGSPPLDGYTPSLLREEAPRAERAPYPT